MVILLVIMHAIIITAVVMVVIVISSYLKKTMPPTEPQPSVNLFLTSITPTNAIFISLIMDSITDL